MMERESVMQVRRAGCRGRKRRAADKAAFDVSVGGAVCRVNAQCWRVEELDGMLVMDNRARGRDARDQRGSCRVLSDLEARYRGRSHKLEAWESVDGRSSRQESALHIPAQK